MIETRRLKNVIFIQTITIFVRNFDSAIFVTCVSKFVFNLVMTSLFKWEISFKMFWQNISNSVKNLFRLQTLGMCSSNPNDNASSSLDKGWYDEKLCTVSRMFFIFSPNVNLLSFQKHFLMKAFVEWKPTNSFALYINWLVTT